MARNNRLIFLSYISFASILGFKILQSIQFSLAFTSPRTKNYANVLTEATVGLQRRQEYMKRGRLFSLGGGLQAVEIDDPLVQVVKQCKLDSRMVTINKLDLPLVVELYAGGSWKLGIMIGFKPSSSVKSEIIDGRMELIKSPTVKVVTVDPDLEYGRDTVEKSAQIIDAGQITTIWKFPINKNIADYANFLSNELSAAEKSLQQDFPVSHGEELMQSIYESIMAQSIMKGQPQLTKKEIARLASSLDGDDNVQQHAQQLLKKAFKIGGATSRLIDSLDVARALSKSKNVAKNCSKTQILLSGAALLALDAELGGRFKRSPSIFVSARYKAVGENIETEQLTLINGGWFAVDESVRAGAEARKFAERSKTTNLPNCETKKAKMFTAADERIMYRLECLAMGEELGRVGDLQDLELDVKEALSALSLNKSPEGAQQALVQIGRWSQLQKEEIEAGRRGLQKMHSPWSSDVLNCAKKLKENERLRRSELFRKCSKNKSGKQRIDGRKDLTALPAVCIDAKRASFRDDAIGIRPRSSTGRKIKSGCKFELLVHIADVSDIYAPKPKPDPGFDLTLLKKSAESRGSSRYDLPLGPLHLMPPIALEALALDTKSGARPRNEVDSVNRCVTLWVYIDTKSGCVIDSGLERTLIRTPLQFAFEDASQLLDTELEALSSESKQTKSLLTVIEQCLSAWKENRLKTSEAARKREKRFQVKEMVAKETMGTKSMRDDGAKGSFQRSRGHRIVDNSLDLYGVALSDLLIQSKAPIPRASGSGMDRGGRLGTAPLRRYIDGVAQRQALSVLCEYGGPPMTRKECSEANKIATEAINNINNLKSSKKGSIDIRNDNDVIKKNKALRTIASHFASKGVDDKQRIVPALSTGNNNEVVLSGIGLFARCGGVQGTLKSGERVRVKITQVDVNKGVIKVELVKRDIRD